MRIGRRAFTLSAAAFCAARPGFAAPSAAGVLRAAPGRAQLAPVDYAESAVWCYNGAVPGPEIRVPQGGRVTRRLENALAQPTSIHWHGIRLPNAMDGVPGLTQEAVPPGEGFDYDFPVRDAGTYWYHTHNRSWEQMARGLAGPLIVSEPTPPDVDQDLSLAVQDWRLDPGGAMSEDFGNLHDFAHAGRLGNLVTVNGTFDPRIPVQARQRLRLRLLNISTARVYTLALDGLDGWVMALDGMPLPRPEPAARIVLAPAQRADLLVDVTAEAGGEAFLVQIERDGGFSLASFPVTGTATRARRDPPAPLPPNPIADFAADGARSLTLRMEGGAMGGLAGAVFEGRRLTMPDLAQAGQVWALNGVAGMDAEPLFELGRGEVIRLPLVNDTAFAHAMHLHGHHFREIGPGGMGPWRDTILVDPGETREIALQGENPGKWLLHCHMLGHQASGMKTWFTVA